MSKPNKSNPKSSTYVPGLEGVVAAQTRLSRVDGEAGQLIIAGFPVEEIAPQASFEEMVFLLWTGDLPTSRQLSEFCATLAQNRSLPQAVMNLLYACAAAKSNTMDALRIAAGALTYADQLVEDYVSLPMEGMAEPGAQLFALRVEPHTYGVRNDFLRLLRQRVAAGRACDEQ